MKKRIISIILGASMLLTASIANAAVTFDQMNVKNTIYRSYTDAEGNTSAIMNSKSVNDMIIVGDWVYISDRAIKTNNNYPAGSENYVTAYNTITGEYFKLEDKATISKEDVTEAVNYLISGSGTAYNFYASNVEERNGSLYVAYRCAAGNQETHTSFGGYRIYDVKNPSAPIDVTGTYTFGNTEKTYTGVPLRFEEPVYNVYPITDDLAVVNKYKGMSVVSTSDKSNWVELYQDAENKEQSITNCVYDEETKLLYLTRGALIHIYDLSNTSNIVKKGSVNGHAAGSSNSGTIAKGAFAKTDDGFVVAGAGVSLFDINIASDGITTEAIGFSTIPRKQTAGTPYAYFISGDYLYICTGSNVNNYFELHDISNVRNNVVTQIKWVQTSNFNTLADGSANASTLGGCYGQHLSADGNKIALYNLNIGPNVFTIGKDLIVPDENGIIYKNGDEIVNGITSGNISVTTEISNVSFEDKEPYVVTALYNDETLEMEKIEFEAVTVKAGENVKYPQTIAVPATGDYHIETFVFYDLDEILAVETGTQGILE